MSDTLSDVLRAVRLRGAVFFTVDAAAPWVVTAPAGCQIGPHIMPGIEHVIEYHVVTKGSCWAGVIDQQQEEIHEGDVIVFPQGDSHVVSSAPGMHADPYLEPFQDPNVTLPLRTKIGPKGGKQTELVCGFLGCDTHPFNPLLATLPRFIRIPKHAGPGALLEQLVNLALTESNSRSPGSESMLARLSELLFIEVVRRYVATLAPEQTGWLAGLRDENVGRALAALHDRPAHPWTLDDLAKEAGLSRSMIAERFVHYVGVPPMQYLAQWRMQMAASLLTGSSMGIGEIAEKIGYGSETALSRAFKRLVGIAPSAWRKGERPDALPVPIIED